VGSRIARPLRGKTKANLPFINKLTRKSRRKAVRPRVFERRKNGRRKSKQGKRRKKRQYLRLKKSGFISITGKTDTKNES